MTHSTVLPLLPRRSDDVVISRHPHGAVVRVGAGDIVLNPTALALWEICDGRTSVEEMLSAVCEVFAVDRERARSDVRNTLMSLADLGIIR